MATLKEISDQIAGALNRPFDDMFKERIKQVFRQELATYIRQQINKHGIDNQFKTRYSTTCIPVNDSDSSLDASAPDNTCYRTSNKVAKPVRYNTDEPFTYVGSITGKLPYRYSPIAIYDYKDLSPVIKKTADLDPDDETDVIILPYVYDYRNGYIYIYLDEASEESTIPIMIEGVHSSYDFIGDESKEAKDKTLVYLDTVEFPMPDDIIQLIKEKLLSTEFSIIDDKDKIPPSHIDNN